MFKKIILIITGITALCIIIAAASIISYDSEPVLIVTGDIIIQTKSSRPGCDLRDGCYVPSHFIIKQGKTVVWLNEDSAFHSVTSGSYDNQTDLFDSGYLNSLESYSMTFENLGIYDYFCTLHPWMNGTITVQ